GREAARGRPVGRLPPARDRAGALRPGLRAAVRARDHAGALRARAALRGGPRRSSLTGTGPPLGSDAPPGREAWDCISATPRRTSRPTPPRVGSDSTTGRRASG